MHRIIAIILTIALSSCGLLQHKAPPEEIDQNSDSAKSSETTQSNDKAVALEQTQHNSITSKKQKPKQVKKPVVKTAKKASNAKEESPKSVEEVLETIDRQAGHPDTNENTPPPAFFTGDDSNFVFSPLFEEVAPPSVPPLLDDSDTAENFSVTNLLPQPTPTKDFSAYGFFTPSDTLKKPSPRTREPKEVATIPVQSKDLVDEIRQNFQLDLSLDNPRIQSQLNWYVRNPRYLERTFKRASRYMFHVVEKLKAANLPMELALLPFVESAYDPFAYSHGRASGLWQFIPGTGKIYGLHQNWWYDGRRDVLASTQAAVEYLTYLNKRFDGNWLHALAAYNSGSGRVSGAIRKNRKNGKPTDFWSLRLPKETRAYVPKLIALAKIVKDPLAHGIVLPKIENKPYFDIVDTQGQIDLAQAASLAEIDIQELYKLNPGYNQWATAPMGPHRLLVPFAKADAFRQNLAKLPDNKRLNWTRYSVKSGDSLIKIAKKFNTTPTLIKEVNNLRSNTIRIKQKLLIPVASRGKSYYDLSETNRLANKQSKLKGSKDSTKLHYTVKSGDTLWDLSRAHKVGVRSLAKWNGMAPTDPIKPGQRLLIWSRKDYQQTAISNVPNIGAKRNMIKKIGYKVRKGDSLARIASKFSVSVDQLVSWNNLNRKKYLQPGQKLTIYVDITNT